MPGASAPSSPHRSQPAGSERGPVTAAAAALGHDPAIILRTYAHLYPGDLAAVADAMDVARKSVLTPVVLPTGIVRATITLCSEPALPHSGEPQRERDGRPQMLREDLCDHFRAPRQTHASRRPRM